MTLEIYPDYEQDEWSEIRWIEGDLPKLSGLK